MQFCDPPYFAFIVLCVGEGSGENFLKLKLERFILEVDLYYVPICQNQKTAWIQVTREKIR
jgi:hypothetical protein